MFFAKTRNGDRPSGAEPFSLDELRMRSPSTSILSASKNTILGGHVRAALFFIIDAGLKLLGG
jgi:hypothetical protein